MSNQCSNLCNYRSFSFCTPFRTPLKPYSTTLRPIFPFQHNLILIGRRSRSRSSSSLPLTLLAQSSSDIVLIATTEHGDGSLVFRFGDASEVVENDDVVEEIESQTEQESSVVKVLDGDQDGQVIIKMSDRGYDGVEGRLAEVAEGTRYADVDSVIAEGETTEKEVLLSQSDAKMNDSLKAVESTLDEEKFYIELAAANEDVEEKLKDMINDEDEMPSSDQLVVEPTLDEVRKLQSVHVKDQTMEESDDAYVMPVSCIEEAERIVEEEVIQPQSTPLELKPTIQVVNIDLQDTMGQNMDDRISQVDNEIKDPSVSVKVETIQVSDNEVTDVAQPYTKDESHMVESKDTSEGDTKDLPPLATMHVSDVDMDERLQDMNISEATFIDEMPISDPLRAEPTLEVSTTKGMDVKDVDMDERLQDMNISEGTFIDEIPASDPLGAEPTLEVSSTEGMDVKDLTLEVSSTEGMATFIDEMPISDPLRAEPTLEVSTTKGMDVKDVDMDERLQDMNISEGTFIDEIPASDPLGAEPSLEVSSTEGMDVEDRTVEDKLQPVRNNKMDEKEFADVVPVEPILEEEVSQPHLTPVELQATMQVSDIKVQDSTGQILDDEILQVINEDAGDSYIEDVEQSSYQLESYPVQDEGVKHMLEQRAEKLQDMNISEVLFIDEMPTSDPLGAEPTLEVSTTEGIDVKDLVVEDELQLVSNDNMDENEIADVMPAEPILEDEVSQPHLTLVELKATMQVSGSKVQDATSQNLDDEILRVISEDAGDSYIEDVQQLAHQLESHPVQDEGVKHMLEQCAESDAVESSILEAHNPLLESERTKGMVGSSELAEASEVTALLLTAEAEVEREEIYLTDDFLLSGAALLEHQLKALTGGDDAYFVAGSKWLGVADGVSQWSFEGTDRGVYAQELMKTCEKIVSDSSSVPMTNPVELLCRGVKETNMSGSSNVLIANFNDQVLHVANIGDTGFLIIRHGVVYKKSSPSLHEFHFALQVEDSDDPLQLVEEYVIELEVGDIVVSATDGLFDNLYEREITMIVSKSLQAGMKPEEIANILATRAQEVGKSAFVRSPFSDAAQAAGYTGYAGGKPDNVAVIVSLVEKRSNLLAE
ncbi:hypothetical protein L1987_49111 [Smallanthus sonchifolius]|uniref:Uncharacterized protein n=1 Tax=Smallanthus sonchifolius TaxID=185202 RepID=A0ACB9FUF3_9ASTR|nr:hypothetical protein L1987_49111 [Smallanthus sonchifolius]